MLENCSHPYASEGSSLHSKNNKFLILSTSRSNGAIIFLLITKTSLAKISQTGEDSLRRPLRTRQVTPDSRAGRRKEVY
jgi:hypothetical protein